MTSESRKLLFKLTRKDFRWVYFSGTGGGGQHRNKHENCVRLFHDPSGATAVSQEERSKEANERKAFERLAKTETFQKWLKQEAMRVSGELAVVEAKVEDELLKHTLVETQDEAGKWQENKELAINHWDIQNLRHEK